MGNIIPKFLCQFKNDRIGAIKHASFHILPLVNQSNTSQASCCKVPPLGGGGGVLEFLLFLRFL